MNLSVSLTCPTVGRHWVRPSLSLLVRIAVAWLCAPGLTAWAGSHSGSLLTVELRPLANIKSPYVRLGDVAFLDSPDLPLLRKAIQLPLGRSPRIGEVVSLDAERVGAWLHARLGLPTGSVGWVGPSSTQISTIGSEVSGDEVIAMAQAALQSHLARDVANKQLASARIELQPISTPTNVSVAGQDVRLQVRSLGSSTFAKRMVVWVDVFSGDLHLKAVPVRFEVSVFAMAPVATTSAATGSLLSQDALVWQEAEITLHPSLATKEGLALSALTVRKALEPGEVVTLQHLKAAPAVTRGASATLLSGSGAVSLESRVEVLQDGHVGQLVRVKPLNAVGSLVARVIAPGQLAFEQ